MEWRGPAIILSSKVYGEHALLVRVFSESEGVFAGMVRLSKKARAAIQPGNLVDAHWSARLQEHLGTLRLEPLTSYSARVMHDSTRLSAMMSALSMVASTLPERDPHPALFVSMLGFLAHLSSETSHHWLKEYVLLEMEILKELGFGLDLTSCAATEATDNLIYVSPRSARAVSKDAGAPYHDKLLPLPAFLLEGNRTLVKEDIFSGLRLTGFFLGKHLEEHHHTKMPAARERLLAEVSTLFAEALPA